MMPRAGDLDAFPDQSRKINFRLLAWPAFEACLPSFQHLLNRCEQAVAVQQHESVELAPLFFVQLAPLQGFQIEPDRSDGSFQLMRDRIDEAVVLFVAPDLPNQ